MHGVKLGILLLAFIVSLDIQAAPSQQAVALAGEWRGDSVCQVRPSACNDEKALYRVATVEGKPDRLAITFAKVVDGRTVVMGTIDDCLAAAAALNPLRGEGFVVRDAQFHRVKIKCPQYVALTHLKTAMNGRRLLEIIRPTNRMSCSPTSPSSARRMKTSAGITMNCAMSWSWHMCGSRTSPTSAHLRRKPPGRAIPARCSHDSDRIGDGSGQP